MCARLYVCVFACACVARILNIQIKYKLNAIKYELKLQIIHLIITCYIFSATFLTKNQKEKNNGFKS